MQDHPKKPEKPADERLQLSSDRPKEHLDDDRLGYANFARSLARSIAGLATTDGIVLAVNGPWGSGKTTAVNMIVEALANLQKDSPSGREIVPVRFNPWWFSEQEDLIKAFFAELSGSLDKKISEKVGEGFRKLARRVASSKELVVAGLGLVPGMGAAKELAGAALGAVGALAGDNHSLSQLRDGLSADLRAQEKRILVIIDDVDRLPADEVRQIFRLVKSVADLPNVIHLLIFDREIAERAFDDPANELGPKWHEKIVQAAFDLPPVQRVDIQQLFIEGLNKLIGAIEVPDATRWGNVFHDGIAPWLRTPRDASRLLNSLVVTWPAVARDVAFADFVALETLRLFEPSLHAFIRHNPHRLTGLVGDLAHDEGTKASLGKEILDTVEPAGHERAKAALQRLFPKLESVWGNHGYASGFTAGWDRERRVCIARRFPAYFGFGIGDDVLSRNELESFAANIADGAYVRRKLAEYAGSVRRTGGTKAAVLLEELSANIDLIPAADLAGAVMNLFDVADLFMNPHDERGSGFLSIPAIWRFWFMMKPLLKRLDESARADALRSAFAGAESLQGLRFGLMVFRTSLGRDPEAKPDAARPPIVGVGVCEELEEALRARFRAAAADGKLLAETGLVENLIQWVGLGGKAEVRAWTDSLLDDDAGVVRLAEAATQISGSHAEGDRVIRDRPIVHRPGLEKVVDVDRMIARLDAVAAGGAAPDAARVIGDFKRGLKGAWPFTREDDDEDAA
ncbi:MAG: P-loop NTPase fold protein [Rhizobiaceae bacterium]